MIFSGRMVASVETGKAGELFSGVRVWLEVQDST